MPGVANSSVLPRIADLPPIHLEPPCKRQLRDWAKKFADDPQHSFPDHGQMKPKQLELARLKREVIKLKAERDSL